ncbi:hypothetical protein BH23GEM6_BH23GEM6_04410 [soil metagenome]
MKLDTPSAPAHLSPAASRHWGAILERWTFDPSALLVLQGAFEAWDLAARARVELASQEIVVTSSTGVSRQNPAFKAYLEASKEARLAFASLRLELPSDDSSAFPWKAGR